MWSSKKCLGTSDTNTDLKKENIEAKTEEKKKK